MNPTTKGIVIIAANALLALALVIAFALGKISGEVLAAGLGILGIPSFVTGIKEVKEGRVAADEEKRQ